MKLVIAYYLSLSLILTLFVLAPKPVLGSTSIGLWQFTSSMNAPRFYHVSAIVGNYVYVMGGSNGIQHVATVERALINPDGSLGNWEVMPPLTISRMHPAIAVWNDHIFVSGGEQLSYGGPVNTIESAVINPDGSLGQWSIISTMPSNLFHHTMVAINANLYILGGSTGSPPISNTVLYAPINPDGTVGAWINTSPMTLGRGSFTTVASNSRLYAVGGNSDSGTQNSVESATINVDGSLDSWVSVSPLIALRAFLGAIAAGTDIYALGGGIDSCSLPTVERTSINPDGSLIPWALVNPMINSRKGAAAVFANSNIYVTGGTQNCVGQEIFSSVERAVVSGLTPAEPNPVVFIPGFGGSWSHEGLVLNLPTDYSDWELIPKLADSYYMPLLDTLKAAGLSDSGPNQDLFTYAYDYRQSVVDSGQQLNTFLEQEVLPKNPGEKVDLIAHSMGGLVARFCYQTAAGCAEKIDQIITAGTPHLGTLHAYDFWEAGKIHETDILLRYAERLILQLQGHPKVNPKTIVQTSLPGVRDLLPVFDYIDGNPYANLIEAKNPTLENLHPVPASFSQSLLTLSGNDRNTQLSFTIRKRGPHDILLNWWVDGKPKDYSYAPGDETILHTSSQISGATNLAYPLEHKDYFNNVTVLSDILTHLGLAGTPVTALPADNIYSVTGSETISLSFADLDEFKTKRAKDQKSLFLTNPKNNYLLKIAGLADGDYDILTVFADLKSEPAFHSYSGTIKTGETRYLVVDTN